MSNPDRGIITVRAATGRDTRAQAGTVAIVTASENGTVIEFGLDRAAVEDLIRLFAATLDAPQWDTDDA